MIDAALGVSLLSLLTMNPAIPGTESNTMDVELADLDGDGVPELIRAGEYRPNQVLRWTGETFAVSDAFRLPEANNDSEDIAIADFDGDGRLDIAISNEDTRIQELYLNTSEGLIDVSDRLVFETVGDSVIAGDFDGDGDADLVFSDHGPILFLTNDGAARFTLSRESDPGYKDAVQDLEFGDVDGDGDLDIIAASEGPNRLLINDGIGGFTAAQTPSLSMAGEETREIDFVDLDGDGDLDAYIANVDFRTQAPNGTPDRLLINDGDGGFTDESQTRLPDWSGHSIDVDAADLDGDGDPDLIISVVFGGASRTLINDGTGVFSEGVRLEDGSINIIDTECLPMGGLYSAVFQGEDQILDVDCR